MTIICDGQSVQECDENQDNMRRMLASGLAVFAIAVGRIVSRVEEDLSSENSVDATQVEEKSSKSTRKSCSKPTSPTSSNSWSLVQETWG